MKLFPSRAQVPRLLPLSARRCGIHTTRMLRNEVLPNPTENHPEETTGEINQGRKEFVLYYSNVFIPTGRFNWFLPQFLYRKSNQTLEKEITETLPEGRVKMLEFVPRDYEGGIFVKYGIEDPNISPSGCVEEIISNGRDAYKRFMNVWQSNVFLVRGTPWIEDMKRTFTTQIRVTFDGPDLSPQQLYAEMRQYGRILDILPPAPGTKDLPRSAVVTFDDFFHAATARNCVNGITVGDTTLQISFIQRESKNPVTKWFSDHPRISIPILIALLAGLAFYIFEPIRILSITTKARGYLDFGKYGPIKWLNSLYIELRQQLKSFFKRTPITQKPSSKSSGHNETVLSWNQVYETKNKIIESLKEGAETFNVIVGPRGSGKSHVVNLVVSELGKTPIIQLDCEELLKAKNDASQLDSLSKQLGYRPAFLWTSTFSRFIDLATTSLAGQSSGFSETTDQQAKRMLNTASTAVQLMALRNKPSDELENDYLSYNPDQRPVVIIKNYRGAEGQEIYKTISQWAGSMIAHNTARVIVVTQDVSYENTLGEILPDSVLRVNALTDADTRVAKQYIIQSLENAQRTAPVIDSENVEQTAIADQLAHSLQQIKRCPETLFEPLGGRLQDLQNYSRRLCAGDGPIAALKAMITATELEVEQVYLNSKGTKWTCEQAWVLIRRLAQVDDPSKGVNFAVDIAPDLIFKGSEGEDVLRQLEYREMLVLNTAGGEIISARPGKPLYHAAFQQLVRNPYTCNIMDTRVLQERLKIEQARVTKVEDELVKLAQMPNGWAKDRQRYLSDKLHQSQIKIDAWEKESKKLLAELQILVR